MRRLLSVLAIPVLLSACQWQLRPQTSQSDSPTAAALTTSDQAAATRPAALSPEQAKAMAEELYDDYFQLRLEHSPSLASRLALSTGDVWDDVGDDEAATYQEHLLTLQRASQQIPAKALSVRQQLYLKSFQLLISQQLQQQDCRLQTYAFSTEDNWPRNIVETLERTEVSSIADFHRYLASIRSLPGYLQIWQAQVEQAASNGIIPVESARRSLISRIDQQLGGFPFSDSPSPSRIWQDLHGKLKKLGLYPKTEALLEDEARSTLTNYLLPALRQMRTGIQELSAPDQQNMQQLPQGDRCYRLWLNMAGATGSAEQLHDQAKSRIQQLQQQLGQTLGFDPGVAFAPQLRAWLASASDTPDDLISASRLRLEQLNPRLGSAFAHVPDTALLLRRDIDKQRPRSWYQEPLPEIGRPGIYHIDPRDQNWQWLTALYRNTLPGRHMQVALAQENNSLPLFLKTSVIHDYAPGWPTLAAALAIDLQGYNSPQESAMVLIQRLQEELELALDTGIHIYQWDRELALTFCQDNSALDRNDCLTRTERIMQRPGRQAAAAISFNQLVKLRQQAEESTGKLFSAERYRSALLRNGALPPALYSDWLKFWKQQLQEQAIPGRN